MRKLCPSCSQIMRDDGDKFLACETQGCNTKILKRCVDKARFLDSETKEKFLKSHQHSTRGHMQKCPSCNAVLHDHGKNMVCGVTTCDVKIVARKKGNSHDMFGDIPNIPKEFFENRSIR